MDLDELLEESFHTYKLYLECNNVLNDRQVKLSLLKWPDITQSALGYIKALDSKHSLEAQTAYQILYDDFIAAIVMPVKAIYDAAYYRVSEVMEKEPLNKVEPNDNIIILKENYINAINDMFKVLETMTGIEYPTLSKRERNASSS